MNKKLASPLKLLSRLYRFYLWRYAIYMHIITNNKKEAMNLKKQGGV